MKKNAALVAIVVALGLALSYVSSGLGTKGAIALACVFAFSALMCATMTEGRQ